MFSAADYCRAMRAVYWRGLRFASASSAPRSMTRHDVLRAVTMHALAAAVLVQLTEFALAETSRDHYGSDADQAPQRKCQFVVQLRRPYGFPH